MMSAAVFVAVRLLASIMNFCRRLAMDWNHPTHHPTKCSLIREKSFYVILALLLGLSVPACNYQGGRSLDSGDDSRRAKQAEPEVSLPAKPVLASYYGPKFHGKKTASGEIFDQNALTAAHRTLPFGSRVRVTHVASSKSVVVRINDRGPFKKGRVIDLSAAAAKTIGLEGVEKVRLKLLR